MLAPYLKAATSLTSVRCAGRSLSFCLCLPVQLPLRSLSQISSFGRLTRPFPSMSPTSKHVTLFQTRAALSWTIRLKIWHPLPLCLHCEWFTPLAPALIPIDVFAYIH